MVRIIRFLLYTRLTSVVQFLVKLRFRIDRQETISLYNNRFYLWCFNNRLALIMNVLIFLDKIRIMSKWNHAGIRCKHAVLHIHMHTWRYYNSVRHILWCRRITTESKTWTAHSPAPHTETMLCSHSICYSIAQIHVWAKYLPIWFTYVLMSTDI